MIEKSNVMVNEKGDMDEEMTMIEYINQMELEITQTAMKFAKRVREYDPPKPDELEAQKALINQVKIISQSYARLARRKQVGADVKQDFKNMIDEIRKQKSSVGEILGKINS